MAQFQLILTGRLTATGDLNLHQKFEAMFIQNQHDAVTGVVLISNQKFVQILEGEQFSVVSAFGQICSDSSLTDVILIQASDIDNREFGSHPMSIRFASESALDWELINITRVTDCLCDESEFRLRPERARTLLHAYFDE